MTDNSDDKAKALANITLFKVKANRARGATLLNLEALSKAAKHDHNINGSLLWDTDDDRFYFLTGHIIGADNELWPIKWFVTVAYHAKDNR